MSSKNIRISARSQTSFLRQNAHQVAHYRWKWEITEIHAAMPIIHGIPPFQLRRVHCSTISQYFSTRWVVPTCSGMSRYRNSVHSYEEISCALCYQDIIQHSYKLNDKQKLACSKYSPNFRTINILLPETQGPQSCPLRVNSTDPHSSPLKST